MLIVKPHYLVFEVGAIRGPTMSKHTHSVFPIPTFQALLTAPLVILKEKVVPFQSSTSTSPFGVLSRALAGSPNRWAPSWKAGHALWTPTVVVLGEHLESQRAFTSRSPVGWSEKWTNQGAWSADHSHWTVTEATTNGSEAGGPQTWGWYWCSLRRLKTSEPCGGKLRLLVNIFKRQLVNYHFWGRLASEYMKLNSQLRNLFSWYVIVPNDNPYVVIKIGIMSTYTYLGT